MNYIVGGSFIMMGVSMVVTSVVRANGAVVVPLVFLIISALIVRLGVGFAFHPRYGADAIWWAFVAGAVVSIMLTMGYYLQGSWRQAHMR
jgi:Na+-driven multidrug efflux pump